MKFILKNRLIILLLLIACTIPFVMNLKHIEKQSGVESLLPEGDKDYVFWKEMEDVFGATDQIVIAVRPYEGTVYQPKTLALIDEFTRFFEDLKEIDEDDVLSLTNVDDMTGENDELLIDPLIESMKGETPGDFKMLAEKVKTNPLFKGKIVSDDEKNAVIMASVKAEVSLNDKLNHELKLKVDEKYRELNEKYGKHAEIYYSGTPILKGMVSEYMSRDLGRLFPLAILLVMVLLYFILKKFMGAIIPILVTLFSVIWTFGLKGMMRSPLTITETMIPVMLIAIGCADGVHIVSEFFQFKKKGLSSSHAVKKTLKELTMPVIMTSLTTSIGFGSLLFAPAMSIKNMGVYLAFGVLVAMLFSLVFIPIILSFISDKKKNISKEKHKSAKLDEKALRMINWVMVNNKWVSGVALLFLVLSVVGVLNVRVDENQITYFKKSNPFRQDSETIEKNLGGITALDIIISGDEAECMKNPHVLKSIEDIQLYCEKFDLVSYTMSISDFLKRINYVLHDNNEDYNRLPRKNEEVEYTEYLRIDGQDKEVRKKSIISGFNQVSQYLLLYEMGGGDNIEKYLDSEYENSRIVVRLRSMSSHELKLILPKIESYIKKALPEGYSFRFSNHYVRMKMIQYVTDSQIYSLVSLLISFLVLLSLVFRSVKGGVLTSLPVFIAVLFNFFVMWITGITLNIGTSIIAAIGMGVGIDYAIHFYARYEKMYRETKNVVRSVRETFLKTYRGILANAFAVGLGFTVLMFSDYQLIMNVGWIKSLSMLTTSLSSIIILPAVILFVNGEKKLSNELDYTKIVSEA